MDLGIPLWKENYDGYMLMKFMEKEEYREAFLDGKLFFNTADYYSNCEQDGRGDMNEGDTFVTNFENPGMISANLEKVGDSYAIVIRDYTSNPSEYKKSTIFNYSSAVNRKRKIICMYTMFLNIENQHVEPVDSKMEKEFGQYGILILNRQEFFKRVCSAISKNKMLLEAQLGFVKYISMKDNPGVIDWSPFTKKDDFDYQNEFRITFTNENDLPFTLSLDKPLRDIAVPINYKQFKEIHFENEKLLYPITL